MGLFERTAGVRTVGIQYFRERCLERGAVGIRFQGVSYSFLEERALGFRAEYMQSVED